jgi:hypothetical protein
MHQYCTGDATPPFGFHRITQRNIVGNHHGVYRDAFGSREFGCQAEIEPVAGIIFDDQQHARRACYGADRGQ